MASIIHSNVADMPMVYIVLHWSVRVCQTWQSKFLIELYEEQGFTLTVWKVQRRVVRKTLRSVGHVIDEDLAGIHIFSWPSLDGGNLLIIAMTNSYFQPTQLVMCRAAWRLKIHLLQHTTDTVLNKPVFPCWSSIWVKFQIRGTTGMYDITHQQYLRQLTTAKIKDIIVLFYNFLMKSMVL